MFNANNEVAIVGVGPSRFGRKQDRAIGALAVDASLAAIADAGLTVADIDGAMLYDGFAPDIYWWLEGLGFCDRGEAFEWIQDGRIAIDGEFPINTFGGQVSEGRLHGIGHWVEGVRQIQGCADDQPGDGARQIPDVENILVATGMLGHGVGVILSTEPR
jgi:acetyl-CoA acetyltransferase